MKTNSTLLLWGLAMYPLWAATISTNTRSVTVDGRTVTVQTAPARSTGYYRLTYDTGTGKVKALVFSAGITETISGLYAADSYAEVESFAETNHLTALPKDPNVRP